MARTYRLTPVRRFFNALVKPVVKLGVGPTNTWLLSVRGRRSGHVYTTPVNLVEREGKRYLVTPYGERSWVRNARAAGEVTLRRGRRDETKRIEEVPAAEAGAVLREYYRRNPITRPFFDVKLDSSDEEYVQEASRHPVFCLG